MTRTFGRRPGQSRGDVRLISPRPHGDPGHHHQHAVLDGSTASRLAVRSARCTRVTLVPAPARSNVGPVRLSDRRAGAAVIARPGRNAWNSGESATLSGVTPAATVSPATVTIGTY